MTTVTEAPTTDAAAVVTFFLRALENGDRDRKLGLLAEDAVWINVTLPIVRGRERIMRVLGLMPRTGTHIRVHIHNVADDGGTVLTERTDAIGRGRFEQRFSVYGRFEIVDGKIKVWHDSFDWVDIVVSLSRAFAGIAIPSLNRRWPGD
jgi:limonene-1,2-epoxide hydrolase